MSHRLISALVLLAALVIFFILVPGVFLTLFAGLLLAVALRALACPLARRLGIGEGWGLAIVAVAIAFLFGLAAWLVADGLAAQIESFREQLPRILTALRDRLSQTGWGRSLLGWLQPEQLQQMFSENTARNAASYAFAGLNGLLGGLGDLALILLLGLYLAADPGPYRRAAVSLVAPSGRPRVLELLDEAGTTLRGWLAGQLFAMVFTGTVVSIGLTVLGVPLAGLLGLIAALFGFIPYIGPLLSVVPAVLVALGQDASLVPWVLGLFAASQMIEGNLLTPMVQSRTADVPPAYLLAAQAVMGTGFGLIGIVLAAPLAAFVMVAVRVGYVEAWVERDKEARLAGQASDSDLQAFRPSGHRMPLKPPADG